MHARQGSEHAQSILEFALIAPFLLLFLLAIVDFGLALNRKVIYTNAAREAARYASLGFDTNTNNIAQIAVNQGQGGFKTSDVSVYWIDKNGDGQVRSGEPVAVKINYTYNLPIVSEMLGFFRVGTPSIDLSACSDMALDQDVSGVTVTGVGSAPCGGG